MREPERQAKDAEQTDATQEFDSALRRVSGLLSLARPLKAGTRARASSASCQRRVKDSALWFSRR